MDTVIVPGRKARDTEITADGFNLYRVWKYFKIIPVGVYVIVINENK